MMTLREAAAATGGRLLLGDAATVTGVSTDSRALRPGALFVAIRGERFDGHDFLAAAKDAGAAAALVERRHSGPCPLPAVVVDDTREALGRLAAHWRSRFSPALVAVTGSNGKTTVKEMLAAVLRRHAGERQVLATTGNLNNDIGVPLTLLGLEARHRYCAIELGMNHRGEIAALAAIARPTVALVNNAQREHLEFMGSVDEVAAENAAVYDALPDDGVAVVNADDPRAGFFRAAAGGRRILDFALDSPAAVSGGYALRPLSSEIRIRMPWGETAATLAIPGLHNVRNALAAAACAAACGVAPEAIGEGLSGFRPYTGRLQIKRAGSLTVIDDTYNANPDSVRAAIDVLASCAAPTVLALGDMGEVGEHGADFHREVGAYARSRGVSRLLGVGEATRFAVQAFGADARHFERIEEMAPEARRAATVLVKGSRFMRMERLVAELTGQRAGAH